MLTDFGNASGVSMGDWKINYKLLDGTDVADSILYVLRTPPHVQVIIFKLKYEVEKWMKNLLYRETHTESCKLVSYFSFL